MKRICARSSREKNLTLLYVNSIGTDQQAHPRSQISAFAISSLEDVIATVLLLDVQVQKSLLLSRLF